MKIVRILYHALRRADRRWVLNNINPMADEVHKYVLQERHHDDCLKKAWAA